METPVIDTSISVGDPVIKITPGLTEYHSPDCDESLKPCVGQKFATLSDGIEFYKVYAKVCGFDARLGSTKRIDGVIIRKYVFCNREGDKFICKDDETKVGSKRRRRASKRMGCMARIVFKYVGCDGYVVKFFEPFHCHTLVSDEFRKYLRGNKNVGSAAQFFILNCARVNMGPLRSHRMFKEMVGSYAGVGCTGVDFKNFSRDLRAYVSGADAQILLNKLFLRRESCSAFYFDYHVDKYDRLTRLFWADPVSRRNYAAFGEVVSFDSTYSTNKYKLVFAPFTGKDNHGKLVTFGAALIPAENQEAYAWVFERFLDCMGHAPVMIITDQDLGIKVGVKKVFPETKHRLCMWHIMLKVPLKTPSILKTDGEFRKRLNDAVWSDVNEPLVFEEKWNALMVEYHLSEDSWFSDMFDIRQHWVAAYFRDVPMSGLCRTTSISESVNSMFNVYMNKDSNLLEFFMHFDSAIDAQRNTYDLKNNDDHVAIPKLVTLLHLEKHAAKVYTLSIFAKVQQEISDSCFKCSVASITKSDCGVAYGIDDGYKGLSTVFHSNEDDTITCSCKKFFREGLLCRHVFVVMKHLKFGDIPERYVVARWTRTPYSNKAVDGNDLVSQCAVVEDNKILMNLLMSEFFSCLGAVDGYQEKMNEMLSGLRGMKTLFDTSVDQDSSVASRKKKLFEQFYGAVNDEEIYVLPPLPVTTKGSKSRLKSKVEAAIEHAKKPLRMCKRCGKMAHHDSRNCKEVLTDDTN